MRTENTLHLRSIILVLLMLTSFTVPLLTPFEESEESLLDEEDMRMQTSNGPQLVVDVENALSFGSSNIDRNHGFAGGPNGTAYVIGEFQGTLAFGNYSLVSSGSYFDGYVAKMTQGNWDWAVKLGGTSTDRTYGLAVDSSGNAFVTGNFYGTCHFYNKNGQSSGNLSSAGSADLYVAKLKSDGSDWLWQAKIGSSGYSDGGNDIVLDSSGDAYVSGYIGNNYSVYDYPNNYWGSNYTNGGVDAFVGKIDSSGTWEWIQTGGSSANDVASRLDVDGSGNVVVGGYYQGNSTFGSTPLIHWQGKEAFVAKVSSNGDWLFAKGGTGNGDNTVRSVKFDSSGDIYYLTHFSSNLTMSAGFTSSMAQSTLVGKISGTTNLYVWNNVSSSSGILNGINMALSPDGNLTVVGEYSGTATFSGQQFTRTGTSGQDGYIQGIDTSNGNQKYVFTIGSGGNNNDIHINDLMFDSNPTGGGSSNTVVFSGYFKGTMALGPSNSFNSAGNEDGFIAKVKFAEEGCYLNGTNYNNATDWVQCAGGSSGFLKVRYSTVHSSGSSYHIGTFENTSVFGNTVLTSSGEADIFIAKLSSSGSWQWAVKAGGSTWDVGNGIAVDSSGNAYVTGYFQGTAIFGSTTLTSSGGQDIFIGRLSSSGSWQWVEKAGGSYEDRGRGIDVDSSGNVYVSGYFVEAATFGSTSLNASGAGDFDLFIAKLSSSGSWSWAVKAGGPLADDGSRKSIAIDSGGNAYVTGYFQGTAAFGSTSLTSSGSYDIFIAKLSSSGSWTWAVKAGGAGNDQGNRIAVDSSGNVYVAGIFNDTASFGNISLTSSGNKDIFIAKFSNSGSWTWAVKAGGLSDDYGYGIAVDSSGNAYATGAFAGTATFGSTNLTSSGSYDSFIGQVSSSGNWVWANSAGGAGSDYSMNLALDSNGVGYVGGTFSGDADIGMQSFTCLSSSCGMFVKTPVAQTPAADGNISVNLEFDYANTWLKGNWTASNLVTGHDYNVSWTLKYQNNGTQISSGWPDSFYPQSDSYNSPSYRTWASGYEGGKLVCYEVELRDGNGLSGPILDTASSCTRTPTELTELNPSEASNAVQISSSGNCAVNSNSNSQNNICDGNTGTTWVSADNYEPSDLMIDFDLGTSAVRVNAVAAYVNNPDYMSTIKNVRLQFLNETGAYEDIGIFQIDRTTGWQYFGGFSVSTTEIRWDVLSNHGFQHTVLFEGKVLDIPSEENNNGTGIKIRYYADTKGWDHESGSHYSTAVVNTNLDSCLLENPSLTDSEDQAHAVACHYVFGHPSSSWASTYSRSANDPWVGSTSRNDGEIRPFVLSEINSETSNGPWSIGSWSLFIPESMLEKILPLLDSSSYDFMDNTSNYITYTFNYTLPETPSQNLATGGSHSCAIQKNETLRCWGENNFGQLGSQQYSGGGQYSTPQYNVELPTGTVPLAVSVAYGYSCAIVNNGSNEAYCWGRGDNGKLGNGNLSNSNAPGDKIVLPSGANPVYISSSNSHSCVISDDEDIYCWGQNNQGQLGNGSQGGYSSVPTIVNSGVGFKSVSTGYEHTCAISTDGGLYCWGNNNDGQLGDGTYNQRTSPVQITSGPTSSIWKEVATGESHTCAISSSDEIYCWGLNNEGQLGDGSRNGANTPQLANMPAGTTAVSISAGYGFSCGLLENHSTYCWGTNARGYLGDGSWQDSTTPIAIDLPSGSEVVEISSGREHSCILLTNDQIMCWGWGGHGRLGTNSHDASPSPEYVVGGHVWNGLGKDFYHFAPQISFPVEDSEPKLSVMVPLSPLPSSLAVSITSKLTINHNGIIIETMHMEQENQSWADTSNAEWELVQSFYYDVPMMAWMTGSWLSYCIEINLNSDLTGDSIGHGVQCESPQTPTSNDGDYAPDEFEDVWGSSTDTEDEDEDGYSDWIEYWYGGNFSDSGITPLDSDGDGLPDALEDAMGTNVDDTDTDGDGYDDYDEFMFGGKPLRKGDFPWDNDYDGCYDYWETMVGLNATNSDTDGDGVLDCFDDDPLDPDNTPMDSDGDGMPDGLEEEYGTDSENWDSDGDGMPDSFEIIMSTDPWDNNSNSNNWAADWDNILTFKPEASATASSSAAGHPASLIIDTDQGGWSNDTSYWTSSGPCPATIEVDLGSIQYLTHMEIGIIVPEEGHYPRNLSFEYRESSADDWIYLQSFMNGDGRPIGDYWNGDAIPLPKARYVRLNCSDSTDDLGNEYEISIRTFRVWGAKNTQFINPDMGAGNQSAQPSIEAFLSIDSMNQSLTAGYSAQLTNGLDYDIDWRLVETNQGSCSGIPVSIDEGSLSIQNWDSAENGSLQQIFVDYSSISNWNIELCLQLDLYQDDIWLYTDWILVDASSGQTNGTNNGTQNDADGDGVSDLFDICPGTSLDAEVDSTGCPIDDGVETTHNTTLEVEFIENQRESLWHQKLTITLDDPWLDYNHSLSLKLYDGHGNTLYSYFSPMDESDKNGWWRLSSEMSQNPTELEIDLNWEGIVGNGRWEGSSKYFEDTEYPYFGPGNYCIEISLGYQNDSSLLPLDVVNDLFDKEEFCGEFLHESMEGIVWDGTEDPPQSNLEKVMSNKIVSSLLDFMDSTQGQILSIGLAILGFAGKMVLARGQRAKNKRVDKFSKAIRKADSKGRLKIIEMDIEKANSKNKLPRGGYGDLMEQIESQMESLGFDSNPAQGETSGNWTSGDEQDYAKDFQQAADMMWEAQDMMAEAKEEAAMTREAIESVQDQFGMRPQRRAAEPEPEEVFNSKYVTQGIDDVGGGTGPSLPGARMMDLDGDGVVTDEEKQIWSSMSQEERTEFFQPVTDIAGEIKRRNMLREKREKLNKGKRGSKKKKKGKKDKGRW